MEPSEIDRFMAGLDPSSHSFTHCSSLVPRMGVSTDGRFNASAHPLDSWEFGPESIGWPW